jgi:hypothetical protein
MFWKALLSFFVVCFFLTVKTSAQNANFTAEELTGTYSISGNWDSRHITLNKDGTYFALYSSDWCEVNPEDSKDCLNYYKESGNFSIAGNTLKFNILKYRRFDPEGKLKDSPPQNYEFLIIKWSERFYLIHKDSLKEFANAVNMKLEPRKSPFALRYNYFYLRREGIEKAVNDLPDLPGGWNDFLLKKPVKAIILKVENQNDNKIAVINKGSKDGLKVGMHVVTGFSPDGSEIISVKKSSATVKLKNDLKKGDKVRSYYDPDNWFLGIGFVD